MADFALLESLKLISHKIMKFPHFVKVTNFCEQFSKWIKFYPFGNPRWKKKSKLATLLLCVSLEAAASLRLPYPPPAVSLSLSFPSFTSEGSYFGLRGRRMWCVVCGGRYSLCRSFSGLHFARCSSAISNTKLVKFLRSLLLYRPHGKRFWNWVLSVI